MELMPLSLPAQDSLTGGDRLHPLPPPLAHQHHQFLHYLSTSQLHLVALFAGNKCEQIREETGADL